MIKFITGFIRKYPHALLLLYWPLYGLVFELLEWFVHPPSYHVMYCALDDYIPFAEMQITGEYWQQREPVCRLLHLSGVIQM
ncbi:MAG: hypothetical protein IJY74_04560 [Oscillospiraceae bacterium]|nr:hypothetical protein [Oscillospiraceae bacterium]